MEAGLNGKKQTSWRNPNSNRLAFAAKKVDYQDRKAGGTRCPLARRSLGEGDSTRWKLRLGRLEFVR
jgi:hypothetical protein